MKTPPPARPAVRLALIDTLRGLAVAQMIVYHFIYDLKWFGWVGFQMTREQPWVAWRTAIVTQFLLLVGVSLVLRTAFKPGLRDFWTRWAQVAGAALLVSIGSYFAFGPRLIWFGILHFVAAALILVRPVVRLQMWNIALGVAVIALGLLYSDAWFNATPNNVLGFVTSKPRTEDYVPLFPWLGVVLIGAGFGAWWKQRRFPLPGFLGVLNRQPPPLLTWLGRWPLTVYLLHQPVLLSLLWAVKQLVG